MNGGGKTREVRRRFSRYVHTRSSTSPAHAMRTSKYVLEPKDAERSKWHSHSHRRVWRKANAQLDFGMCSWVSTVL